MIKNLLNHTVWIIAILLSLTSCEIYHFEKPQPSDVENLYVVPKEFRGQWQDDKHETMVIIGTKTIRIEGFDSMKVFNGNSNNIDRSWSKLYLKFIQRNEETKTNDTVVNFVVKGNRIYETRKDGLSSGFPFILKHDTLYFKKDVILEFELNPRAFLRKLTDQQYILNVHEENLWSLMEGRVGPWWQVILLERTPDGKIGFRYLNEEVKKHASKIYADHSDYFFDVVWTQADILKLLPISLFDASHEKLQRVVKTTEKK